MDAIEEPLKRRLQEILDEVNVEKIIEEKLPELEKLSTETSLDSGIETVLPVPNAQEFNVTTQKPEEGLVVDESQLDQNIF